VQKIFVGDIQGCGDEFQILVTRARETFGDDFELWCVGDMINRGPKNLLSLGLMRGLKEEGRGVVVVGNHEIGLLRVWLGLWELEPKNTYPEILDDSSCVEWIDWVRTQPLAASGEIEGSEFAMVHAAMNPTWTLDDLREKASRVEARLGSRDLGDVRVLLDTELETSDASLIEDRETLNWLTRCRSVDAQGQWSKAQPKGSSRPWHEPWSEQHHGFGIVYGHWSRQGLHVAPGLRGLDTGCVHHGRGRDGFLTAWLPGTSDGQDAATRGADQFAVPDDCFWQIPALRRYYD